MSSSHSRLTRHASAVALGLACSVSVLVLLAGQAIGMPGTLWAVHLATSAVAAWFGGRLWGLLLGGSTLLVDHFVAAGAISVPSGELALRLCMAIAVVLAAAIAGQRARRPAGPVRADPATGLVNQAAFNECVEAEVERAMRYGRPFTMAYLSVENLPVVRHRDGQAGVDDVLRQVGHHVRGSLRTVDVVARLREQEFAVLLPETGADAAEVVLNRLRRNLTVSTDEDPRSLWFAIGATSWVGGSVSASELHQKTYQLMYSARSGDTNLQHVVHEEQASSQVATPLRLRR